MANYDQDLQTHAVIGAAIEVHRILGPGFLEAVYQEAMGIELSKNDIPHVRELPLPIEYKGHRLGCAYRADFVCFGEIVVEIKANSKLNGADQAQMINYLRATGLRRGLLLNFASSRLEIKRIEFDALAPASMDSDEFL